MKKSLIFCFVITSLLSSCCKHTNEPIDLSHNLYIGIFSDNVVIDSTLDKDTSYYHIYTFRCGNDTIFQYKFTSLLAPGQQFNAQFTPRAAFSKYSSDLSCSFLVKPSILEWKDPNNYMSITTPLFQYILNYSSSISITSTKRTDFELEYINGEPQKIYYNYDWESKMHYEYMRYNADSAILTFSINNAIADTITPIDTVSMLLPSNSLRTSNLIPVEIKDTICIVEDTTYNCTIKGYMKGRKCGDATYRIQVHKNEIVSEQDESHHHQGSIYEYDI